MKHGQCKCCNAAPRTTLYLTVLLHFLSEHGTVINARAILTSEAVAVQSQIDREWSVEPTAVKTGGAAATHVRHRPKL